MLLSRLVELAKEQVEQDGESSVPPYYKAHRVRWILDLDLDGAPRSPEMTDLADPTDPLAKNGRIHVIPSITKAFGIAPRIAVDGPEYVFGWLFEGAKPDRVGKAYAAFRELVDQWVNEDPDGPARALKAFYDDGHAARFAQPEACARGDLIAVKVAGKFLHEADSARDFWATVAESRKASGHQGICLICGQVGLLLKTIPQQLPTRLVPFATQAASLVSINKTTHGFALQKQLIHTPICVNCGLAAMGALERLLDDRWKSSLTGQDMRLAWWTTGGSELDLDALDKPTPESIADLIGSATRGRESTSLSEDELATFCAVAIGGNVSRVVVREWIELPLRGVQDNLATWFADHEVVDAWTGQVTQAGVKKLAYVSGRWLAGKSDATGSYAKWGSSGADRPDDIHRALLRSALLAKPLPPKLLAHIVRRVRTDGRLDTERAALIRLALRRRPNSSDREAYLPTLNPSNNQPAYLAGRVFAVLEDIQKSAAYLDGDEAPNVTFADRYFARAVTSPAVALVAGRRDAQAWLKRMKRKNGAFAHVATQRLEDLFDQIAQAGGMPYGAVLADQAAFILGYHQQWAELRSARSSKSKTPHEEGAPA